MPQKKKKGATPNKPIVNRRARFDYELGEEITTGIILTGPEVRAARDNHVQLRGAYVTIRNGELWLNNASFSLIHNQRGQSASKTVDISPRKLLARHKQIAMLEVQKKSGFTIIPIKLLTAGKYIKVVIALAKGKKHYDKRETIKRRDQERDSRHLIARA